jgi:hypothetical protein
MGYGRPWMSGILFLDDLDRDIHHRRIFSIDAG